MEELSAPGNADINAAEIVFNEAALPVALRADLAALGKVGTMLDSIVCTLKRRATSGGILLDLVPFARHALGGPLQPLALLEQAAEMYAKMDHKASSFSLAEASVNRLHQYYQQHMQSPPLRDYSYSFSQGEGVSQ